MNLSKILLKFYNRDPIRISKVLTLLLAILRITNRIDIKKKVPLSLLDLKTQL